jgi:hypothetical protein
MASLFLFARIVTLIIASLNRIVCHQIPHHAPISVSYISNPDISAHAHNSTFQTAHIKVVHFDQVMLLQVLLAQDLSPQTSRIRIDYRNDTKVFEDAIGHSIDIFLSDKPWWIFATQGAVVKDDASTESHFLMLRHLHWEKELRLLSAIQFPPANECTKSLLLLGHLVTSGAFCCMLSHCLLILEIFLFTIVLVMFIRMGKSGGTICPEVF